MALIITEPGIAGQAAIYGVVRITADPNNEKAEYAILVDHNMIGLGLGPLLMRRIIDYARGQGLRRIYGEVLRENEQMLRLNRALDFQVQRHPEDSSMMHVTLDL
jgi:acetyltransferase